MHAHVHRRPHNDLGSLAHYHLTIIKGKVASGVEDGLSLDCMSCLIALAFHVEAVINFLGTRCVGNWKERAPFNVKLALVAKSIGFNIEAELTQSLALLKEVRDGLAHGKPMDEVVALASERDLRGALENAWDKYLVPDVCEALYDQIKAFKRDAFERAGIPLGQTLTSSIRAGQR